MRKTQPINDSLFMGMGMNEYEQYEFTEIYNINTQEKHRFGYIHPDRSESLGNHAIMDVSIKQGLYARAHRHFDIVSICTLDGALVRNINGPLRGQWKKFKQPNMYTACKVTKDYIITAYVGGEFWSYDKNNREHAIYPS